MDSNALLRRHGRTSGTNFDFTTLFGRKNKYLVAQANLGPFIHEYCVALRDHLINDDEFEEDRRAIFDIAQKPSKTLPIVIDVNLRYSQEPEEPCNDYFIMMIVKCIQLAISDIYVVNDEDSNDLICCVMEWDQCVSVRDERPGHPNTSLYKLRFHFPFCRVPSESISRLVPKLSTYLRTVNAFSTLESSPIGDWDQIIKPFVNDPVPLYGSSERPDYPMLTLTDVFLNLTKINLDEADVDFNTTCSVEAAFEHHHSLMLTGVIDQDMFNDLSPEETLPLYLTNNYCGVVKQVKEIDHTPSFSSSEELPREFGRNIRPFEKSNLDIVNELLPLISKERFTKKISWIDIGKALHHASDGSEEGLQIWIQFTDSTIESNKNPPPFIGDRSVAEVSQEEYYSFRTPVNITHRTIAWYAQEDNPERYRTWHANWCLPYREAALSLSDYDVASALYCDLWLNYACVNPEKKILYYFKNHRWIKLTGGYGIRLYISNQFKRVFEEIRARLSRQIADSHDANYKAEAELTNKRLCVLINQLNSRTFKSKVLNEVMDKLHVDMERFEDIMDTNGNLTGVPNGVIEVDYDAKTIEFRQGKPEDFLSKCTLARYVDMGWDHPRVVELMSWLSKMFVDSETRHFVLKILGSGFIAGNLDKFAPIFTGNVNNSKSALVRAMMYTWGSYSVKFPTTGLTRGYSDSGAPNPAWARLENVRWAFADEPDERECYRSGPFKIIYGNDAVYNRKLFSDGGDVEASATVVTSCNRVPPFPNADTASIERLCLIPCLSTWVKPDKLPPTQEEQLAKRLFPMDKNFINRVRLLCPALLWVSFQYFPIWAQETLDNRPPEVQLATKHYWKENDIYLMYTSDRIEAAPPNVGLTMIEIYNDFEVWFNKYNRNSKLPDRATVREHLISRWEQQPAENVWWGIKLKEAGEVIAKPNTEAQKSAKNNEKNMNTFTTKIVDNVNEDPKKLTPNKFKNGPSEEIEVTDLGFPVIKSNTSKNGRKPKVVVRGGKLITEDEQPQIVLPTIEMESM